ncbi:FadR/GntR family transcriptional regulator [Siminovitchia sp. 179-K 8D1 HS]|uniref:FadR/GntR family transcriptional regulator n=1 Tax=Siminovitchia sp. 179-K 8D1 HS TaxID=3142385 RepID=UPI0039A37B2B
MSRKLSRLTVAEEAMLIIKELISDLGVGNQLPTESQLQKELGISRQVIREVLVNLQAEGYVEIRRGKGTFVIDKDLHDKKRFIEWFQSNKFKIQELIEIRMAIEPFAAKLAAERITDKEILMLEESCERLPELIKSKNVEAIVKEDEHFHNIIITNTKNEGINFIYNSFITALRSYRSKAFAAPANPTLVIDAHMEILSKIKKRDPVGASIAMLKHIEESKNDIETTYHDIT